MAKSRFIPQKFKPWIDARKRYSLTDGQVQMARELGLNPKKFGSLANHRQETWKMPLPQYIEYLYRKQFSKDCPDDVRSVEARVADARAARAAKRVTAAQERVDG